MTGIEMEALRKPTLYLVPVPLGDIEPADTLPRPNLELIGKIKYFIVENIRSARRFLKRCNRDIDIDSLTFFVLDEHTDKTDIPAMLAPMEKGEDMAVISEAGCPAVADPGAEAVAVAQRKGYRVHPLVGPSSILLALMASGFNGQTFTFNGYLPVDAAARAARLKEFRTKIEKERQTQIFIETPYRNNRLISDICRILPGQMLLCVASELTCPGENIVTMSLDRWAKAEYDYDKRPTIFLLYSN